MKPETWLKRAIRKKSQRPSLPTMQRIHGEDGITVALDGARIHTYHGNLGFDSVEDFPDFRKAYPKNYELHIKISSVALLMAAKNALVFCHSEKDAHFPKTVWAMNLHFGPDVLATDLSNQDLGIHRSIIFSGNIWPVGKHAALISIIYNCEGGSGTISVQPKFLKDALWGMAEVVDIWISLGQRRMLIKSPAGNKGLAEPCEALIAAINV